MTIIKTNGEFKIEFNGSKTWMLVGSNDYCWGCFDTERKAINAYNRACKRRNIAP